MSTEVPQSKFNISKRYYIKGGTAPYNQTVRLVLYLKIINTFLKNNVCMLVHLIVGCPRNSKLASKF